MDKILSTSENRTSIYKYIGSIIEIISLIIVLFYMAYINVTVDAANVFNDTAKEIGQAIAAGNSIYLVDANVKDKEFKHELAASMPDNVDCVALGSSTVMGVRREDVGNVVFYNLGLSGSNLYDILSVLGYMHIHEKNYKRIILGIDSAFFCESIYSGNSSPYRAYGEYMADFLQGKKAELPEESIVSRNNLIIEIKQMVSVTYFQANILHRKELIEKGFITTTKWGYMGDGVDTDPYYCYYSDGSLLYNYVTRHANVNNVINRSKNYNLASFVAEDEHPSEFSKEVLRDLVKYCRDEDIEIEFFLPPWAPALWDSISRDKYPILSEGEDYVRNLSTEYGVKITGSWNPHVVGVADEQFYDPRHFRHELLSDYFDFTNN